MACIRLPRVSLRTLGRHPSDASPSSTSRGDITATFACASASCASRPPGLIESIDPRQALRARPVVMVTTGPTTAGSTCGTLACVPPSTCLAPECWSGASLEVFVPCNAHWLRSRCPGRPASGRSRFGVSHHPSTRAPSLQGDLPTTWIFIRPCGFPLERIRCDAARVADALSTVRCVPIESVARAARVGPMGPVPPSVSAGRRSVALTSRVFDRTCR